MATPSRIPTQRPPPVTTRPPVVVPTVRPPVPSTRPPVVPPVLTVAPVVTTNAPGPFRPPMTVGQLPPTKPNPNPIVSRTPVSQDPGGGMSVGAVVGLVAGVIVVLVASVIGGFLLLKKRRARLHSLGRTQWYNEGYPEPDKGRIEGLNKKALVSVDGSGRRAMRSRQDEGEFGQFWSSFVESNRQREAQAAEAEEQRRYEMEQQQMMYEEQRQQLYELQMQLQLQQQQVFGAHDENRRSFGSESTLDPTQLASSPEGAEHSKDGLEKSPVEVEDPTNVSPGSESSPGAVDGVADGYLNPRHSSQSGSHADLLQHQQHRASLHSPPGSTAALGGYNRSSGMLPLSHRSSISSQHMPLSPLHSPHLAPHYSQGPHHYSQQQQHPHPYGYDQMYPGYYSQSQFQPHPYPGSRSLSSAEILLPPSSTSFQQQYQYQQQQQHQFARPPSQVALGSMAMTPPLSRTPKGSPTHSSEIQVTLPPQQAQSAVMSSSSSATTTSPTTTPASSAPVQESLPTPAISSEEDIVSEPAGMKTRPLSGQGLYTIVIPTVSVPGEEPTNVTREMMNEKQELEEEEVN